MLPLLTLPFVTLFAPLQGGALRRVKAHLAALEAAHDAVRRHAEIPADVRRDTGLDPAAAQGLPSQQQDLPFFLQPGFGQHPGA